MHSCLEEEHCMVSSSGKCIGEHNFEHSRCQLGRRQAEQMSNR